MSTEIRIKVLSGVDGVFNSSYEDLNIRIKEPTRKEAVIRALLVLTRQYREELDEAVDEVHSGVAEVLDTLSVAHSADVESVHFTGGGFGEQMTIGQPAPEVRLKTDQEWPG